MNFSDLGLSEKTIQAIDEFGIKEPTTVQTDVIPSILQGKDVFTIAPAGCGKTMSYVFPLIDIISSNNSDKGSSGKNILIVTPDSAQSVKVSDRLAVFNKYHEINEATIKDRDEDIDNEANVIIGSPDLLLDIAAEGRVDHAELLRRGESGKNSRNAAGRQTEHCLYQPPFARDSGRSGQDSESAGRN